MSDTKTIKVSKEVYEALANKGNLKDSFDRVLRRLLQISGEDNT